MILMILNMGVGVLIARELAPSGKGIYSLVTLIPILIIAFGNLGIAPSNTYLGGKKLYNWSDIVSNSIVLSSVIGVVLIAIFYLYLYLFSPAFILDVDPRLIALAVLTIPLTLMIQYLSYVLLGQKRIFEFNLIGIISALGSAIFLAVFLVVLKTGVLGAMAVYLIATVLACVASIAFVRRTTKIRLAFNVHLLKDSIKFGLQSYFANLVQLLNYRMDLILIAMFMSSAFVGYYSVSTTIAETLWYFPGAIGTIMFSRTPGLSSEEANKQTPKICRNTLFITALSALAFLVLGRPLISLLFGPSYLPAFEPLLILLPGNIAFSICKVLSNELLGRGLPRVNAYISLVALVTNVPLLLVFIPLWGVDGAALASTINYLISSAITVYMFNKITNNRTLDVLVIKREDLYMYADILRSVKNSLWKMV